MSTAERTTQRTSFSIDEHCERRREFPGLIFTKTVAHAASAARINVDGEQRVTAERRGHWLEMLEREQQDDAAA